MAGEHEKENPMNSPTLTAVLELARTWDQRRIAELQAVYEAHWDRAQDKAGGRVADALHDAGLYNDTGPGSPFDQIDQLCGIVGGASDVGVAVTARDLGLIDGADFERLTRWWVAAGLSLPEPVGGAS